LGIIAAAIAAWNDYATRWVLPEATCLEERLNAYDSVVSAFGYEPVIRPGTIDMLGWHLKYA
jgi:hypothetical protein